MAVTPVMALIASLNCTTGAPTSVGSAATAADSDSTYVACADTVASTGDNVVHVLPVADVMYCSTYDTLSDEYELLATKESAEGE